MRRPLVAHEPQHEVMAGFCDELHQLFDRRKVGVVAARLVGHAIDQAMGAREFFIRAALDGEAHE